MQPFPKPGARRRLAPAADVMLGLALTLLAACGEPPVTAPAAPGPGGAVQPVVTGTTTLRVEVRDAARNPVAGVAVTVVGADGPIEPRGVTDAAGVAEFLVTSGQPVCVYAVTVDVAAYGFEAGFVPPATPADLVTPPPHGAAMTVRNGRSGPLTVQNYKTFCANPGPVTPTGSTQTVRLQLVPAHRVVLSLLQPDGSLLFGPGTGAAFLVGTGLQCADLPWLTAEECDALAAAQVHPGLLWSANASASGTFELFATPGQPFQIEYFLPVTTGSGSFNLLFSFQGTAGAGGATTTLGTQTLEVQTCQTESVQERSGEKKSGVDFVGPVGAGFLGTWSLALRTDAFATFYQQAGSGPARLNFRIQRPGGGSTLTGEVAYACDAGAQTCAQTGAALPAGMGHVFLWRWDAGTGRFAITIVLFGIPADVLEVQVSGSAPQSGDSWPDPSRANASSAYLGVAPPTGPCASESRFDVGDV